MDDARILIVDDEPNIRFLLQGILEDEGLKTLSAANAAEAHSLLRDHQVDCILLDVWLPDGNGLDMLPQILGKAPEAQVIMISGHANVDVAVKALKQGAYDFMEKPLQTERVLTVVGNALRLSSLKAENRQLRKHLTGGVRMIGSSQVMEDLRRQVSKAASSEVPVFVMGENGTGKELVAREIHLQSSRSQGAFVAMNCAAIPDTLIESEIFGHEKGAFTNAVSRKRGRFELAHRGTLFMDEVMDLSLAAQAKLLRALQEQAFERVGGTETLRVDVRVVSASNKDPHEAMAHKDFRQDLFYRLHVFPLVVPPLRDRREDIPELVDAFLTELRTQGLGGGDFRIDAQGMKMLEDYDWPGNVRQLRNMIQRIVISAPGPVADVEVVDHCLAADRPLEGPVLEEGGGHGGISIAEGMGLTEAREAFEKGFILQKLSENGYNISRTAEILGMYPSHLHGKIKKLGIRIPK